MINIDKVKHIANLAKLNIKDEEMSKYQKQLTDILTEIDKIVEVDIDEDIMISPSDNKNNYSKDEAELHIDRNLAFKNAKNVKSNYITVPKALEGEE